VAEDAEGMNVRRFGAVGDGATDDTGAIQNAVDAAAERSDTIFFPPGIYACSTIKLRSRVGLAGHPAWSYRDNGGATLRLIDPSVSCLLDLTGAAGVTISGLCLDGGKVGTNAHGIMFDKKDYGKEEDAPRIERCRISRFTGDGIHLGRIWCFSIRSCMVAFNAGCGIRLRGWDGFILDNWLSGNGGAGLGAYEENSAITMNGNRIEWNRGGGIAVRGGNHYNITGNYFDRSGGPAISLLPRGERPCRHFSIAGNLIYRSGTPFGRRLDERESCHVRIEGCRGLSLSGNTMAIGRDDGGKGEWSPRFGIVMSGLDDSVVACNSMHEACLEKLILDLGGHGENFSARDNVGSLFVPPKE